MEFLRNGLIFSFSPEVASTMLWFLKRWTKGYFSLHEASDTKLSPTLIACFDLKHDCGKFLIKLLLDVVELNLNTWTAEPQVSEDVVKLLLRLINQKKRYVEIIKTCPCYFYVHFAIFTVQVKMLHGSTFPSALLVLACFKILCCTIKRHLILHLINKKNFSVSVPHQIKGNGISTGGRYLNFFLDFKVSGVNLN